MNSEKSPSQSALITATDEGIALAAKMLTDGKLVAFPTETVYGLGANALNNKAVLDIFTAKGRPQTDPLIVHVEDIHQAETLIHVTEDVLRIFRLLGSAFWPGPLTIIVRAKDVIPEAVTASTGLVGIRCPRHPLAQSLLRACSFPIAAPSANRFGHVSPTRAQHVLDDLGDKGVAVLDGESAAGITDTCEHGIESTVLKIDSERRLLVVLRMGSVTVEMLERLLLHRSHEDEDEEWGVEVVQRSVHLTAPVSVQEAADPSALQVSKTGSNQVAGDGQEAPGQSVTHYSPDVTCFMVSSLSVEERGASEGQSESSLLGETRDSSETRHSSGPHDRHEIEIGARRDGRSGSLYLSRDDMNSTVVIDFNKTLTSLSSDCLAYRDLSPSGSVEEAARGVFEVLRWSEKQKGATCVLIAKIPVSIRGDLAAGVSDRLFRAASGVMLNICFYKEY
eukprot:CAMPEP_0182434998 /NCGR_PEP_ID=MMETSP1167-20130531/72979_1 /TAXON_ID=2988 /ORGANISM="Mallomonas Sp, Strain CCMP3275" /LENGTH=449 /DNA_ID=CAMNT_0024625495 /DNA_START=298 /DNA_END=1647 /DNA_ORIENTATION=+